MVWWHGYCKHAGSVAVHGVGGMVSECSGSGWRWSKHNNINISKYCFKISHCSRITFIIL